MRESITLLGQAPDRVQADMPPSVWTDARNVHFRDGKTKRIDGDQPTLPGAQTGARAMAYLSNENGSFWVYAKGSGIWAHNGLAEFDITPANWSGTGNTPEYTTCIMGGLIYVNFSDRDPVYWDGNTAQIALPLPGWPASGRCFALRAHRGFLFAVGFFSEGIQRVRWSDVTEPGAPPQEWEPSASNLAGFVDLQPFSAAALEAMALQDEFLVYKAKSIHSFQFVGGNDVWQVRQRSTEYGVAGVNCITQGFDDRHLFIGRDGDVYINDGTRIQSILNGTAQNAFYENLSSESIRAFASATLSRHKMAVLAYSSVSAPVMSNNRQATDLALIYDFTTGVTSFRDMPPNTSMLAEGSALDSGETDYTWETRTNSWKDDPTNWSYYVPGNSLDDIIAGGSYGFLVLQREGHNHSNGVPINAMVERSGLTLGDAHRRKCVKRLWPKVSGQAGNIVTFRIGGQEYVDGPTATTDAIEYEIGNALFAQGPLDFFIQGRYITITVESEGGRSWEIGSIDLEYDYVGQF